MKTTIITLCLVACFTHMQAQVKLGNNPTTISSGSALEVESTDKGVRMPQIALTNTTTWAPLQGSGADAASRGMSVYNTNAAIASTNGNYPANGVGEYYWDGTGWVNKNSSNTQNSMVLFSIKRATVQNMVLNTWVLIDFTAEDYDKNNNYNLATNKFTVPTNGGGYYQLNCMFATTAEAGAQGAYVGLFVNNVFRRYITIANAGAGSGIASSGSITLPLVAGDLIDIRYNGNTAGQAVSIIQVDMYQLSR
jgi:hypothetical protein